MGPKTGEDRKKRFWLHCGYQTYFDYKVIFSVRASRLRAKKKLLVSSILRYTTILVVVVVLGIYTPVNGQRQTLSI